jgi:hypothetical protein
MMGWSVARADVLFDTGPPRQVLFDATNQGNYAQTYLGFSAGDLSPTQPQRWMAQPFSLPAGNWAIDQIDLDFFSPAGFEFNSIELIVWERDAPLNLPPVDGEQVATQSILLSDAPGIDDPEIPEAETYLHQVPVDMALSGGDYYLTAYGKDIVDNHTANLAWLTNAENGINLIDPDGNAFAWRSSTFPAPGFQFYQLPGTTLMQLPGLDPDDLYNTAFTIYGTSVPEPAMLGLFVIGVLTASRRRR